MKAEFQKILKLFEEFEEAGETASLTLSTKGGKSTIKLQLESSPSLPSTSTTAQPLPPASGWRCRHRGARARARRNQWAAAHQSSKAGAASSAPLDPKSSRPLCSLPPESGSRRVMSCVGRLNLPTFSNLDGAPHLLHQRHTANCWGKACSPNSMYTTTSLSSTTLPHDPPEPGPTSPLPPPCFTDPHPLCCHCPGTCPRSSGAR